MRNQRGITLIALVVTIVVLLILAGVTITYALGENGLFSSAKRTELAAIKSSIGDAVSTAQSEALILYFAPGENAEDQIPADATTLVNKYLPADLQLTAGSVTFDETSKSLNTESAGTTVTRNGVTYTVVITKGVTEVTK